MCFDAVSPPDPDSKIIIGLLSTSFLGPFSRMEKALAPAVLKKHGWIIVSKIGLFN